MHKNGVSNAFRKNPCRMVLSTKNIPNGQRCKVGKKTCKSFVTIITPNLRGGINCSAPMRATMKTLTGQSCHELFPPLFYVVLRCKGRRKKTTNK